MRRQDKTGTPLSLRDKLADDNAIFVRRRRYRQKHMSSNNGTWHRTFRETDTVTVTVTHRHYAICSNVLVTNDCIQVPVNKIVTIEVHVPKARSALFCLDPMSFTCHLTTTQNSLIKQSQSSPHPLQTNFRIAPLRKFSGTFTTTGAPTQKASGMGRWAAWLVLRNPHS